VKTYRNRFFRYLLKTMNRTVELQREPGNVFLNVVRKRRKCAIFT
jgi:hypothetical protein